MAETMPERLRRKLTETFAETWDHTNPVDAVLDPDTAFDERAGVMHGGISFRVKDSRGAWQVVHHEPMGQLHDVVELDNWLARGLSQFLMKHPIWPK